MLILRGGLGVLYRRADRLGRTVQTLLYQLERLLQIHGLTIGIDLQQIINQGIPGKNELGSM